MGVRANCLGDQKYCGLQAFESMTIPMDHPTLYEPLPTPPITKRLGFPVDLNRIRPDKAWGDMYDNDHCTTAFIQAGSMSEAKVGSNNSQDATAFDNPGVTSMYMEYDCDPHSKNWGQAPAKWQHGVGSVLFTRTDGKALHPHHVEALCRYCQHELPPMFGNARGTGRVQTTKEQMLDSITSEKFAEFFEKYRIGKASTDPSWLTVENPCNPVDEEESGNAIGAGNPPGHPAITRNPDSDYSDDDYDDDDSDGIDDLVDHMQDLPRYGSNRSYK